MGFRFRKSINFGPFRLNASKTGLGWSVGGPGGRYTQMANGRTRTTVGIPGTGISWVEESKKAKRVHNEFYIEPKGWRWYWNGFKEAMGILLFVAVTLLGVIAFVLSSMSKK